MCIRIPSAGRTCRTNSFRVLLLILVSFASQSAYTQTGVYVPELKLFDAKMNGLVSKYSLAGGQMAITYQGRLVYNRGFGFADTVDRSLVQPQSIFRLASVSKAITSVTVMKLHEKGVLDLDAIVLGSTGILNDARYLNALDSRMYQITVRQLLNHSSGFNYDFANEPLWQTYDIAKSMGVTPPTNSFELVLEWTLKNKSLGFQPGTSAGYSNFGYTLLGLVIEKVTGMKYETYVRDSILQPLGIVDMHAGRTFKTDKFPNEVSYHDYNGAPLSKSAFTGIPNSVPAQYGGYHWEIMTPAGGWVGSASDLCKLLTAVDGLPGRPDMLTSATIDTMTQKSQHWTKYGLGWFVTPEEMYHTGGIQGTATVIRTDKSKKISYAILFNALPQDYTPMYNEFISLVGDEFSNIASFPAHDLFDQTSDIGDAGSVSEIIMYPNPTSTLLNIHLPDSYRGRVKMYNYMGQKAMEKELSGERVTLSVENLQSGMYLFVFEDTKGIMTSTYIFKN